MFKAGWGDELEIGVIDDKAVLLDLVKGGLHIDGVPDNDGIGDEGQTGGLDQLLFEVMFTDVAFIGDEEKAAQGRFGASQPLPSARRRVTESDPV